MNILRNKIGFQIFSITLLLFLFNSTSLAQNKEVKNVIKAFGRIIIPDSTHYKDISKKIEALKIDKKERGNLNILNESFILIEMNQDISNTLNKIISKYSNNNCEMKIVGQFLLGKQYSNHGKKSLSNRILSKITLSDCPGIDLFKTQANLIMAINNASNDNLTITDDSIHNVVKKFKLEQLPMGELYALNRLAIIYMQNYKYTEAEKIFNEMDPLFDQYDLGELGIYATFNKALLYKMKLQYVEAMQIYNNAYRWSLENNDSSLLATTANNIARIFKAVGEYKMAMKYFSQGISLPGASKNNPYAYAITLLNISTLHRSMKNYKEGHRYADSSLNFSKLNNYKDIYTEALLKKGSLFLYEKKYDLSFVYLDSADKQATKDNLKQINPLLFCRYGQLHSDLGNFYKAIQYSNQSLELLDTIDLKQRLTCYQTLSYSYEQTNQKDLAIKYYSKTSQTEQSIRKKEKVLELARLEIKSQLLQDSLTIQNLENKAQLSAANSKKNTQRVAFLLSILGLALIGLSFYTYKRNKFNNKLKELYSQLEEGKELSDQLNYRLNQSNEQLEKFAAVAAHDLKAPLTTLNSSTMVLKKKYKDVITEKDKIFFEFINDSTRQLSQMIEELLSFSKLSQNLGNPSAISLTKITEQVKKQLDTTIKETNSKITINPLPDVAAHASMVFSLFLNLLNNAIKYSKQDNAPNISISQEPATNNYTRILIKDNGIGIGQEDIKSIFEPFKQLHGRDKYSGVGIGLSQCKNIVEYYNGEIGVISELGKGSTFYFTLPVISEQSA